MCGIRNTLASASPALLEASYRLGTCVSDSAETSMLNLIFLPKSWTCLFSFSSIAFTGQIAPLNQFKSPPFLWRQWRKWITLSNTPVWSPVPLCFQHWSPALLSFSSQFLHSFSKNVTSSFSTVLKCWPHGFPFSVFFAIPLISRWLLLSILQKDWKLLNRNTLISSISFSCCHMKSFLVS